MNKNAVEYMELLVLLRLTKKVVLLPVLQQVESVMKSQVVSATVPQ